MFADLGIFKMSSMMASHAGRRQALAAQNMANVDTPGYRGKRLQAFSDVTKSFEYSRPLKATRDKHLHGLSDGASLAQITEQKDNPAPDGNTVSAETELLESINAEREHKRALAVYKSALNILHKTISGR